MASQPPSSDSSPKPWMVEQEQMRSRTMTDLQRQIDDARAEIRRLARELRKEQARHAETAEAYNKTVSNMVEIARENALLNHELERMKRAPRHEQSPTLELLGLALTPHEARVIRKAMARLHHPDVGGDEHRMKVWNAVLDQLEACE